METTVQSLVTEVGVVAEEALGVQAEQQALCRQIEGTAELAEAVRFLVAQSLTRQVVPIQEEPPQAERIQGMAVQVVFRRTLVLVGQES
jgi:hypothetical protein